MRYVAAYLLAVLGGNSNPSAKDIKNILGSVGIEADDERLNKVISELNGKDINEVMNAGLSKLASVPAGGAVAVSAAAAGGGGAAPAGEAPAEKADTELPKEYYHGLDDLPWNLNSLEQLLYISLPAWIQRALLCNLAEQFGIWTFHKNTLACRLISFTLLPFTLPATTVISFIYRSDL
uniref:Large ribosomal subunit protein P2 n=1 Tax=Cyprinus carpio carpio TaxID=630221 RepID=A0A9J7WXG2_CYPCA